MESPSTDNPEMGILVKYMEKIFSSICGYFPQIQEYWKRRYTMNCINREEISIVSCVFMYFIALIVIYLLYAKCLQGLLKKMQFAEINRSYLLEALWYVGLCGASIPSCLGKLMLDYNLDGIQSAYHTLFNDKAFVTEDRVPSHLVFLFVLFCALSAHSVWLTWSKDGFNIEFFTRLCFFLFFSSTYSLRCVLLGVVCMLLININAVCAEITRIFCIVNSKKSLRTYSGKYISYIFFVLYCVFWSAAFLYVLPTRVLRRTITMHVRAPEDLPALVLLNIALLGFFWLQLLWAPASMAVQHLAWRMGHCRKNLLDAVLFPSRDAFLAELRALRLRVRQQEAEQLKVMNINSFNSRPPLESDQDVNKKSLFQTVRCVMALKRRLRNRRLREQEMDQSAGISGEILLGTAVVNALNHEVENPLDDTVSEEGIVVDTAENYLENETSVEDFSENSVEPGLDNEE